MTPKQKAEELVNKFLDLFMTYDLFNSMAAKEIALLHVEEIIKMEYAGSANCAYYESVKEELKKL